MTNSVYRSDYIAEKNKRFFQSRMNDDTFNLNSDTSWAEMPMTGIVDKVDKGFVESGNGAMSMFSDWVEVEASCYQTGSSARTNVEIAFGINGVVRPVIGSSSYIRNASGHNHSSSTLIDGFYVNYGDVITLHCRRESNSGTVTSPIGSTIMKMKSSPTEILKGPSGTYLEGFETDFGYWVQKGSDDFIRYTGATPSSGTGSAGAKTGAYFTYAEVSNNANLETFAIQTNHFNLLRQVSFSYQLEGNDCGTLSLDYKNEDGLWVNKWSVSGNQGASYIDVVQNFDTLPDANNITDVKFTYSGATGYAGDCCLDDISIVSVD